MREYKGKLAGLKAGFVGDGYNMANSLIVHRGEEITPDVFETHADEIFDEAENRLHVEKKPCWAFCWPANNA